MADPIWRKGFLANAQYDILDLQDGDKYLITNRV